MPPRVQVGAILIEAWPAMTKLFGIETEQQTQRRKYGLARTRRRHPQEEVEHHQQRQGAEGGGRSETEGQAEHQATPCR